MDSPKEREKFIKRLLVEQTQLLIQEMDQIKKNIEASKQPLISPAEASKANLVGNLKLTETRSLIITLWSHVFAQLLSAGTLYEGNLTSLKDHLFSCS